MSFSIKLDVAAVLGTMDNIDRDCQEAARPAAQAGAQVLYDQVVRNVQGIKAVTGNLRRSIYQAYSKDNSGEGRAQYHISWNAKKAPHGHLVEWGHLQRYEITYDPTTRRFTTHKDRPLPVPKQIGARPFVRPAVAKMPQAQEAMRARYLLELERRGVLK